MHISRGIWGDILKQKVLHQIKNSCQNTFPIRKQCTFSHLYRFYFAYSQWKKMPIGPPSSYQIYSRKREKNVFRYMLQKIKFNTATKEIAIPLKNRWRIINQILERGFLKWERFVARFFSVSDVVSFLSIFFDLLPFSFLSYTPSFPFHFSFFHTFIYFSHFYVCKTVWNDRCRNYA